MIEGFFVLLKRLFSEGLVEVETDFFGGVSILIGLCSGASMGKLLIGLSSFEFIIDVHHF